MSNYIDTRDLITERNETKEQVLNDWNDKFNQELDNYDDIDFEQEHLDQEAVQEFKDYWLDEVAQIGEIDALEDKISSSEFDYGLTLIEKDYFEDFVEQDLEDCGYIPKDFPTWIEIDWERTANNVKQDYSEVDFRGTTYLYRD